MRRIEKKTGSQVAPLPFFDMNITHALD